MDRGTVRLDLPGGQKLYLYLVHEGPCDDMCIPVITMVEHDLTLLDLLILRL